MKRIRVLKDSVCALQLEVASLKHSQASSSEHVATRELQIAVTNAMIHLQSLQLVVPISTQGLIESSTW